MDDEHKVERVDVAYAVEDEHCLNGKVPRTGTVRRRNDDGDAAHDERYESARHTKVRRSLETEEREIIVEEITRPYAQRERHEKPRVLHVAHSHDALPDATHHSAYLIIYGKALQQIPREYEHSDAANGSHGVTRSREFGEYRLEVGARLCKERVEDAQLESECEESD